MDDARLVGVVDRVQDGRHQVRGVGDGSVAVGEYRAGFKEGLWVTTTRDGQVTRKEFLHGEPVKSTQPAPASPPAGNGLSG